MVFQNKKVASDKFNKLKVAMKYWLLGRNYLGAVKAMEYAMINHTGFRKDGITPEFFHQLQMALYARCYEGILLYPEDTFSVIFLHDVSEDYDVPPEHLKHKFGGRVSESVSVLTKKFKSVRKSDEAYYQDIGSDPIASVVKGIDRINNIQTCIGVFSLTKQSQYVGETVGYVIPMLRRARRSHVEQEVIYESLKFTLESQVDLVQAVIASGKSSREPSI